VQKTPQFMPDIPLTCNGQAGLGLHVSSFTCSAGRGVAWAVIVWSHLDT